MKKKMKFNIFFIYSHSYGYFKSFSTISSPYFSCCLQIVSLKPMYQISIPRKIHTQSNVVSKCFGNFLSNCLTKKTIPIHRWGAAYKGALSFRCSNYFICFLSHSTALLAGLVSVRNQKHDRILGYSITKPWAIELPRSLVDVVVYWNLSMHYWLKTCNFHFYSIFIHKKTI